MSETTRRYKIELGLTPYVSEPSPELHLYEVVGPKKGEQVYLGDEVVVEDKLNALEVQLAAQAQQIETLRGQLREAVEKLIDAEEARMRFIGRSIEVAKVGGDVMAVVQDYNEEPIRLLASLNPEPPTGGQEVKRQSIIIARWAQHDATCKSRENWALGIDPRLACDCGLTKALHPQEQQG